MDIKAEKENKKMMRMVNFAAQVNGELLARKKFTSDNTSLSCKCLVQQIQIQNNYDN
ncbi:hypothetical protein HNP36_000369 [Chryseobacterium shigense]|uniref:Uncharacterized protein n=1 Tax=Chryseobacterium shigense TaxID=297244 RepID=A0A841MWI2_9FLAO|nr:hypothetical protein [Chryseobacterium shigense]